MIDTSKHMVDLSPDEKRPLLAKLLREKASQLKNLPLSFAQQRLWFRAQMEPNSPLYNISRAVRLSGALNIEALQKTLDAIVARHEVLRTTFVSVDRGPVQVIAESQPVEMSVIDLSEWPKAEQWAEVQRLLNKEAKRPINLSHDLMLRATLLRL